MKRLPFLGFVAVTAAGLICGCVTSPAPNGQASSAYAVGDRTRVVFEEIIVSLPLKGATQPYQNLHLGLAATINPVKTTRYDPDAVSGILKRLEPRISARVADDLTGLKEQTLDKMPALRIQVAREAQAVIDETMQRWQHGSEYEVKVLAVSLYWTDTSVGRVPTASRLWW